MVVGGKKAFLSLVMVLGILCVKKKKEEDKDYGSNRNKRGLVVISQCLFLLMQFVSSGGDGQGWILFAEGSSGGGGGGGSGAGSRASSFLGVGGGGGGFWTSAAPSNVGIAVAVTAMAGIALAATVVYSRR